MTAYRSFALRASGVTNGIQTVMAGASGRGLFDFAQELACGSSFKPEETQRRNERRGVGTRRGKVRSLSSVKHLTMSPTRDGRAVCASFRR